MCQACVIGCSNCITSTTCSSCLAGYFWVNNTFCSELCSYTQSYNFSTNGCDDVMASSSSDAFNNGEFSYEWTYGFNGTDLILYVVFSRVDVLYYYYQGGIGYGMNGVVSKGDGNGSGSSFGYGGDDDFGGGFGSSYATVFYDDGNGYYQGYSSSTGTSSMDSQSTTDSSQWESWSDTTVSLASLSEDS